MILFVSLSFGPRRDTQHDIPQSRTIAALVRLTQLSRHLSRAMSSVASPKAVVIGSDHGGFELKMQIVAHLEAQGVAVEDVGCHSATRCDYPDIAALAGKAVADGKFAQVR